MTFDEALTMFIEAINEATKKYADQESTLGWCDNFTDTHNAKGQVAYFRPITIEQGSKYVRLVNNNGGSRSVYCFINKETGDILKAAGWKAPAKGARGNIFAIDSYNGKELMRGAWLYR